MGDVPDTRVLLLNTSADAAASIAGEHISPSRRRRYRSIAAGPGTFKLDIATSGPIPWADRRLAEAGTVHLGGSYAEIAAAEAAIADGTHPDRPFVLLTQPLVADRARAPAGTGIVWAYAHVPTGSTEDMTDRILDQIERFAPGFRTTIRTIVSKDSAAFEEYNPNFRNGDITGGAVTLRGILQRPTVMRPYRAGPGVYLCSSATPPGAGVHGMCGHHAARAALKEL
jgi:phytoene dehydrogenase-like protein